MWSLRKFVTESNRIEGIDREPIDAEIDAHETLLRSWPLSVDDICQFVSAIQPGAVLRNRTGLDVRVGNHIAPQGGPIIVADLIDLLEDVAGGNIESWDAHIKYETLHPFTDGNGRSGRAIWLCQHNGRADIGFLHAFYYQTLSSVR